MARRKIPGISVVLIVILFLITFSFLTCTSDHKRAGVYISVPNEKATCDSLFNVAEKLAGTNTTLSAIYLNKAYSTIKVKKCKDGMARFHMIKGRIYYYEDRYAESVQHLDTAILILQDNGSKPFMAKSYSFLAATNACMGNYPEAIQDCLTAEKIYCETGDDEGRAGCYSYLGAIYKEQKDFKKSLDYLEKAYFILRSDSVSLQFANVLSALADVYVSQGMYDKASYYLDAAYQIRLQCADIRHIASSLCQLADFDVAIGKNTDAFNLLLEAEQIYINLDEKMGLFNVYYTSAMAYLNDGDNKKALGNVEKAYELACCTNSTGLLVKASEGLYKIYRKEGNYHRALDYLEEYQHYNGLLISSEKNRLIANIEQNHLLQDKIKDNQILQQQNTLKKQQVILLWMGIVLLIVVLLLLIIYFSYRNRGLKQKQLIAEKKREMAEAESRLHEKEKKLLENDLELKNKELASKTVELLHQIETLQTISERMEKLKSTDSKKELNNILHDLKLKTREHVWDDFHTAFNNVHKDFYNRLFELCPDLSSTEIKIAALLKLNLSTKEIAAISYKSESAVKTTRHRLRQKLKLPTGEDLISFLMKI